MEVISVAMFQRYRSNSIWENANIELLSRQETQKFSSTANTKSAHTQKKKNCNSICNLALDSPMTFKWLIDVIICKVCNFSLKKCQRYLNIYVHQVRKQVNCNLTWSDANGMTYQSSRTFRFNLSNLMQSIKTYVWRDHSRTIVRWSWIRYKHGTWSVALYLLANW